MNKYIRILPALLLAFAFQLLNYTVSAQVGDNASRISAKIKGSTGFVSETFRNYSGPILIVVGLILLVVGAKLVKPIIFLSVTLFGFLAGDQFINAAAGWIKQETWVIENPNIVAYVAIGIGVIAGLLSLFILKLGLFLCGCAAWYFSALWLYTLPFVNTSSAMASARLPILIGGAVFCGILLVIFKKTMFVPVSAAAGAISLFFGADLFAETGFSRNIMCIVHSQHICEIDTTSNLPLYAMAAGCIATAILSMVIQFVILRRK